MTTNMCYRRDDDYWNVYLMELVMKLWEWMLFLSLDHNYDLCLDRTENDLFNRQLCSELRRSNWPHWPRQSLHRNPFEVKL